MSPAKPSQESTQEFNPNSSKNGSLKNKKILIPLVLTAFLFLAIPLTVYTVKHLRQTSPKAAEKEQKNLTPQTVAGLVSNTDDMVLEYQFSYDPVTGKAKFVSLNVTPHYIEPRPPTSATAPEEYSFDLKVTNSHGKKFQRTKKVTRKNAGNLLVNIQGDYLADGEVELFDKDGRSSFKGSIKDLPKPTDIPAQIFFAKLKEQNQ